MLRAVVALLLATTSLFAQLPPWAWEQIEESLRPFEEGISAADLDEFGYWDGERFVVTHPTISSGGLQRIEIRDGQARGLNPQAYGPQSSVVLETLNEILRERTLPDMELIALLDDGAMDTGPVFAFAASRNMNVILWPDYEMMCSYHMWGGNFEQLMRSHEPAWKDKVPVAFFRGVSTGGMNTLENWMKFPRAQLCLFALDHPRRVDAKITHVVQAEPGVAEAMGASNILGPHLSVEEQLRYRYLIDVDGNSCCYSRTYWILLSNSVLFKVQSDNVQWYYRGLIPEQHYMPIESDLSNLIATIKRLNNDERLAIAVACSGRQFATKYLNRSIVKEYIYELLLRYSSLLE
jgi:hypothetical protein